MMVALIPLNLVLSRKLTEIRKLILKVTDERVKWTNEILLGATSSPSHLSFSLRPRLLFTPSASIGL